MGNKIHPIALRLGISKDWLSRWYPHREKYRFQLEEDLLIRKIIEEKIAPAGIVRIEIERTTNGGFKIFIKAARPGLVIGRGGKGIEDLNKAIELKLQKLFRERGQKNPKKVPLSLNVDELKRTEISAQYIAQSIAWDLEKRLPFRRTIKKALEGALQNRGVLGAKIKLSGRLDGGEIARREWLANGTLSLQTLRGDVDYGIATAFCNYGTTGVKVWLYKGEVFKQANNKEQSAKRENR